MFHDSDSFGEVSIELAHPLKWLAIVQQWCESLVWFGNLQACHWVTAMMLIGGA